MQISANGGNMQKLTSVVPTVYLILQWFEKGKNTRLIFLGEVGALGGEDSDNTGSYLG